MADPITNLIEAARSVVERWDTPLWKEAPATGEYINRLREALVEVEVSKGADAFSARAFHDLCQAYRWTKEIDGPEIVRAFEALQAYCRQAAALAAPTQADGSKGLAEQLAKANQSIEEGHDPFCLSVLRGKDCDCGKAEAEEPTCPACHGSGEGEAMEGRGPDTYTVTILCQECGGSGTFAQSQEAEVPAIAAASIDQFAERYPNLAQALEADRAAREEAHDPEVRMSAADTLLAAAHAFWNSEREAGMQGAVKWVQAGDGSLVIFTRGEYRHELMAAVGGDEDAEHRFAAPAQRSLEEGFMREWERFERGAEPHPEDIAGNLAARDREADRARFTDPQFNRWLDEGISDSGHTVWDAVGDVQAAWQGWNNRPHYSPKVTQDSPKVPQTLQAEAHPPWCSGGCCNEPEADHKQEDNHG